MSRKLVFASGLLRCFFCHLDPEAADAREALASPEHDVTKLLAYMEGELARTPLELLSRAALRPAIEKATARKLFDSYDRFLGVLDDPDKRARLETLTPTAMSSSALWEEIRDSSHDFHSGLLDVFFGLDNDLRELTTQYGLF